MLQAIAAPCQQEWGNAHDALQAALDLEKQVNQVRKLKNVLVFYYFLCKMEKLAKGNMKFKKKMPSCVPLSMQV